MLSRISIGVILLLCAVFVSAQTYTLTPWPRFQPLDNSGKIIPSGCLYSYVAGTTTPTATFADTAGTANPNPLQLDGSGRATVFLSSATSYKLQVWTAPTSGACPSTPNTTQLYSQDSITPPSSNSLLPLNNTWTGTNTYSAAVTMNGALNVNAGGTLAGTFTGTPTFSGAVTLSGGPTLSGGGSWAGSPSITAPAIIGGGSWAGSPSLTNSVINGINAQTGTSYTFVAADEQKLVTFNNGAAVAVTLPQATTAGFGAGASFHVRNLGAGTATITPMTSTIDGIATLTLTNGQGADIYSDGANYVTQRGTAAAAAAVAGSVNLTAQQANIASTTLVTPTANGYYRFSCYVVLTQVATTSSTLPACAVGYTDADSSVVESFAYSQLSTSNSLGATGGIAAGAVPTFFAKSGVPISFNVNSYASVGATPMQFSVRVRLEGPF